MREVVQRVLAEEGGRLDEVDVREHPDLEKRYVFEIPVLLREGRELCRHRVTDAELRRLLHEPAQGA
jgi:hypothetical protein